MRLTKTVIDQFTFRGETPTFSDVRWDDELPGFGVRVWPSGKKTFVIRYRHQGRQRYYTLGTYGVLTAQQARDMAKVKLVEVLQGHDPLEKKRQEARAATTFAQLAEAYIERHAKPKKKTWREDLQKLEDYVLPAWGNRRVSSIRRADAAELHQNIGKQYPIAANRTFQMLSKLFECGIAWGYLDEGSANPIRGIDHFRERKRDRFVGQDEMPRLAKAIDGEPNVHIRALIWLYLLTGLRKSELKTLQWTDINYQTKELRLEDTKAGRPHYLPLSEAAIGILKEIPRKYQNPYVFCGRKTGSHLQNVDKAWRRIRGNAGLDDVWLHDLRRTVGSWLAQQGHSLPLIGRVLNHSNQSTTAIYARFSQDPVREALEKHSALLDQAKVEQPEAKVVALGNA